MSLAILSGSSPRFSSPLHVGRPNLLDEENFLARCRGALASGRLTNQGPLVTELEEACADRLKVRHCIAVCNATVGLQAVLQALDLAAGEVVLPSYTFIATAHACRWQNLRPRFADAEAATHNLDPASAGTQINEKTAALVGVHVWGQACAPGALEALAQAHRLPLIFDAAHAFLCEHEERPLGGRGQAEVFSLHATKFFNAAEGGLITTQDDELATRLRRTINFGFAGYDAVEWVGTNAKMNELSAAMALSNLPHLDRCIAQLKANHAHYRRRLGGLPGVRLLDYPEAHNHQYLVLELADEAPLTRDALCGALWRDNVLARRYFSPGCHRATPYRASHADHGHALPVTERLCRQVLLLPNFYLLETAQIDRVCDLVEEAFAAAEAVTAACRQQTWPWPAESV